MTVWSQPFSVLSRRHNRLRLCLGLIIAVIITASFYVVFSDFAKAAPQTVGFSARLKKSSGAVVADGYYNVQFKLYNQSANGAPVWTETYYDENGMSAGSDNRVKVVNGYLSVKLGSITQFDGSVDWQDNLWLTMNIGGTTQEGNIANIIWDGEMSPRIELSATPFAMNSSRLEGKTASDFIHNSNSLQDANFNISGTGSAEILQANSGVVTPGVDRADAGSLDIGLTNATSINLAKDVTVAAEQRLTLVGGATSTRPADPTEGTLYFDTTTKQLLVYANGKWKSDGKAATKIVASSTSAQSVKDSADFVTTGEAVVGAGVIDGDQIEINAAIAALPASGGTIYLTEGTYYLDGSIVLPSNVTLSGAGGATVITANNNFDTGINLITNSNPTGGNHSITIRNLTIHGNRSNIASNVPITGVYFDNVGSGSGASALKGATITGVTLTDLRSNAMSLLNSDNSNIHLNTFTFVAGFGIDLDTATHNRIDNNSFNNTTKTAIRMINSTHSFISNNLFDSTSTTSGAVEMRTNSSYNSVTGNTFSNNARVSLRIASSNSNVISGNLFDNNGGSGSDSALQVAGNADDNTLSRNTFRDTEGTGHAIFIDSASADRTYLDGNSLNGTGASTINDLGTDTIYAGQRDSSGNYIVKVPGAIGLGSNTTISDGKTLNVNGDTTIKSAVANSSTALQVQNAAGATVLNVDTKSGSINTGTIRLSSGAVPGELGSDGGSLSLFDNMSPTGSLKDEGYPANLGTSFNSSVSGYVTGIKFYNPAGNNSLGTDIGRLWSCNAESCTPETGGTLLASATFPSDTTAGWKSASFSSPILIEPGTSYFITYYSQDGMYYSANGFFNQPYSSGSLSVPQHNPPTRIASGYALYSSNFPDSSYQESNYWVDLNFETSSNTDQLTSDGVLSINSSGKLSISSTNDAISLQGSSIGIKGDTTIKSGGGIDNNNTFQVQNSAGDSLLNVDAKTNNVTIGKSDATGTLLVLDTKTNSGDPTGINGAMYYNADAGKFRCYENSEWSDCITPLPVSKVVKTDADNLTDQSADVNDMTFALSANTKYYYKFVIIHEADNELTGVGFGISAPANLETSNWCVNTTANLGATTGHWGSYCGVGDASATTTGETGVGTKFTSTMEGYVETKGTAGDLKLRFKSQSNNKTTVKSGTFGILQIVQ